MSNVSQEGALAQVQQLVRVIQDAIEAEETRRNNPRKRKGGEASWAAATYHLSVLTGQDWQGKGALIAKAFGY